MSDFSIDGDEEINFISKDLKMKLENQIIIKILDVYYKLVNSGKSPNPEVHFLEISEECEISLYIVADVFKSQIKFLELKGIVNTIPKKS